MQISNILYNITNFSHHVLWIYLSHITTTMCLINFYPIIFVEKRKQWWQVMNHKNKKLFSTQWFLVFTSLLPYSHPPTLVKFTTVRPLILYTHTKFKRRILCWIESILTLFLLPSDFLLTKQYKVPLYLITTFLVYLPLNMHFNLAKELHTKIQ